MKADASTVRGGLIGTPSMIPQDPVTNLAEPEITFFCIVKVDADPGKASWIWFMNGNDAQTILALRKNITTDLLTFFTRSSNTQNALAVDTVSVAGDGNTYLVCCQYSFTTKTARLIVNGRDNTTTNALMGTFDYTASAATGFSLNTHPTLATQNFLGNTGVLVFYDTVLLTNAQINLLANGYYLNKYPSLVWTDI